MYVHPYWLPIYFAARESCFSDHLHRPQCAKPLGCSLSFLVVAASWFLLVKCHHFRDIIARLTLTSPALWLTHLHQPCLQRTDDLSNAMSPVQHGPDGLGECWILGAHLRSILWWVSDLTYNLSIFADPLCSASLVSLPSSRAAWAFILCPVLAITFSGLLRISQAVNLPHLLGSLLGR